MAAEGLDLQFLKRLNQEQLANEDYIKDLFSRTDPNILGVYRPHLEGQRTSTETLLNEFGDTLLPSDKAALNKTLDIYSDRINDIDILLQTEEQRILEEGARLDADRRARQRERERAQERENQVLEQSRREALEREAKAIEDGDDDLARILRESAQSYAERQQQLDEQEELEQILLEETRHAEEDKQLVLALQMSRGEQRGPGGPRGPGDPIRALYNKLYKAAPNMKEIIYPSIKNILEADEVNMGMINNLFGIGGIPALKLSRDMARELQKDGEHKLEMETFENVIKLSSNKIAQQQSDIVDTNKLRYVALKHFLMEKNINIFDPDIDQIIDHKKNKFDDFETILKTIHRRLTPTEKQKLSIAKADISKYEARFAELIKSPEIQQQVQQHGGSLSKMKYSSARVGSKRYKVRRYKCNYVN